MMALSPLQPPLNPGQPGGLPMPNPGMGAPPLPQGGGIAGPMAGMAPPPMPPQLPAKMPMLHNVSLIRRKDVGCAKVDPVPPEEFGITRAAKLGDKSTWHYCYHESRQTEASLISQGFDPAQVEDLPTADFDSSEEAQARDTVDDKQQGTGGQGINSSTRLIKTTEHYLLMKYEDDDKSPKLYRITTAGEGSDVLYRKDDETGKKKPAIEPVAENPFDAITPYIMPHRFFGRSVADHIIDLQRLRTTLLRQLLDNMYLANNQRTEISESHATKDTFDDWISNRPGGLVRTKQPGGLIPIPNSSIGDFAYPLLEYTSQRLEQRTGVSRQGQGVDANALMNQSATAVMQVYSAAQAKVKLIARIFAETGIKGLFLTLHGVIRRNASVADTVRLRRKWVEVDPRQWRRRADMTVAVGIGTGTKEQQLAFLWQLLAVQKEGILAPHLGLVEPANIYNTLKKLVEMGGLRSVDPFFTNPDEVDAPEQQPDPKVLEIQGKMQIEAMKLQADEKRQVTEAQIKQQELAQRMELEKTQANADVVSKDREAQAAIALAQAKFEFEQQMEAQRFNFERDLKMMEFQLKQREAAATAIAEQAGNILQPSVDAISQKHDAFSTSMMDMVTRMLDQHAAAMTKAMKAPRRVVRDPATNRVVGVEYVSGEPAPEVKET